MMSNSVDLKYFLIWILTFALAHCLTLSQVTTKPRTTKFSTSTIEPRAPVVSPTPKTDDSGVAYYRLVHGRTDSTCLLLKTDALVEVKFTLHGLPEQADSFIPAKVLIEGDCKEEDTELLRLSWTGYSLVIYFAKTPGGERWYISNIELNVSPNLPQFHGVQTQGQSVIKLYHRQMLIPTPVGKSFVCDEVEVPLSTDEEDHPPPGLYGTLLFRLLQVQPFMYKSEDFSEPFECKSQKAFRDETAPVVVGSTLAVAVLATITGYSVYRNASQGEWDTNPQETTQSGMPG